MSWHTSMNIQWALNAWKIGHVLVACHPSSSPTQWDEVALITDWANRQNCGTRRTYGKYNEQALIDWSHRGSISFCTHFFLQIIFSPSVHTASYILFELSVLRNVYSVLSKMNETWLKSEQKYSISEAKSKNKMRLKYTYPEWHLLGWIRIIGF